MRSWFFDIETADEYRNSVSQFQTWLISPTTKKELGELVPKIEMLQKNTLEFNESLWVRYRRLFVHGFDMCTTGMAEGMHSSLKNGSIAVRPSMNVDEAARTMLDKSALREMKKGKKDAKQHLAKKLWTRSSTSAHLTKYMEGLCVSMLDRTSEYTVVQGESNSLRNLLPLLT